jgi:trimethylguanosine synthase
MGKRKHGGLGGLSGFAAKVFGKGTALENDHGTNATASASEPANATCTTSESASMNHVEVTEVQSARVGSKRRKLDGSRDESLEEPRERWVQKYDATGLVPHYRDVSEVPEHLQKYFNQRTKYLTLYSSPPGCLLDEE